MSPDHTRAPTEPILSYPAYRGLASCLDCRATLVVLEVEGFPDWILIEPGAAERRWLELELPTAKLRFSPATGDDFVGHDCHYQPPKRKGK
jgi:hypothetical protein